MDSGPHHVAGNCPAVPAYEIPRLFEAIAGCPDRTWSHRGAGLGLSIVRSVAHPRGGAVKAVPRPGGGLGVEVTLPARDG